MGLRRGRDAGRDIGPVCVGVVAWPYAPPLTARGGTPLERVEVCPEGTKWSRRPCGSTVFLSSSRPIRPPWVVAVLLQFGWEARSASSAISSPLRSSSPPEHNLGEVCPAPEAVFTAFPSLPNSSHLACPPTVATRRRAPAPLRGGARP